MITRLLGKHLSVYGTSLFFKPQNVNLKEQNKIRGLTGPNQSSVFRSITKPNPIPNILNPLEIYRLWNSYANLKHFTSSYGQTSVTVHLKQLNHTFFISQLKFESISWVFSLFQKTLALFNIYLSKFQNQRKTLDVEKEQRMLYIHT